MKECTTRPIGFIAQFKLEKDLFLLQNKSVEFMVTARKEECTFIT
jgi:hypothetical protein